MRSKDFLRGKNILHILVKGHCYANFMKLLFNFLEKKKEMYNFFFSGELDDKMKWLKNFDRLLEIQRNIVWPSVLEMDPKQYYPEFLKVALSRQPCERLIVSPRRQILIEGPLMMFDAGKPAEMFVILFDDLLIITRKKKALHKKVRSHLQLNCHKN